MKNRSVIWVGAGLVLLGAVVLVIALATRQGGGTVSATNTHTATANPAPIETTVSPVPSMDTSPLPGTVQFGAVTAYPSPSGLPMPAILVTHPPQPTPNLPSIGTLLATVSPQASPSFPAVPPELRQTPTTGQ